jgi:hypothetical protein
MSLSHAVKIGNYETTFFYNSSYTVPPNEGSDLSWSELLPGKSQILGSVVCSQGGQMIWASSHTHQSAPKCQVSQSSMLFTAFV